MKFKIETRCEITVNTDSGRRCYNGANASEAKAWTSWDWLELNIKKERVEERLRFWRELNAYSLSIGGQRREYRAVEI